MTTSLSGVNGSCQRSFNMSSKCNIFQGFFQVCTLLSLATGHHTLTLSYSTSRGTFIVEAKAAAEASVEEESWAIVEVMPQFGAP
jgi:hypothetical protein